MDSKPIQFSILVVSGEGAVPFRCGRPLFCGVDDERLRLRLQGLTLPTIPAGEGRPPLHCWIWDRGVVMRIESNTSSDSWGVSIPF